MDIAERVIQLFTERDAGKAAEMAMQLDELNGNRQQEEQRILQEVQERIESSAELKEAYCLVVDGDGWHRGVIGICATRVVERYHRPTVVLSREDGVAYGSGRSISAFHLLEALESCAELFTRFGGHAHAVGCTLPADRVPELRSRLDSYARARLTLKDFVPVLEYDAEIPLEDVGHDFWLALQRLEPFGCGNPVPVFVVRNAALVQPARVLKEKHLKLRILSADRSAAKLRGLRRAQDVLGWRMAERAAQDPLLAGDVLDVAFTVDYNEHPDFGGVQLSLVDFARTAPVAAPVSTAETA
jgi:single-stranded-DNA-specific exonuclease